MAEVESRVPAPSLRQKTAVADGPRVVRIKLKADRTGVSRSDIKSEMLDVVVKPVRGTESTAPHDGCGPVGIGECGVLQTDDGAVSRFAPKEGMPPVVPASGGLGPPQRLGDKIDPFREIEDAMPADVVLQCALERFGVVGLAIARRRVIPNPLIIWYNRVG
jgi:hypothetical protein